MARSRDAGRIPPFRRCRHDRRVRPPTLRGGRRGQRDHRAAFFVDWIDGPFSASIFCAGSRYKPGTAGLAEYIVLAGPRGHRRSGQCQRPKAPATLGGRAGDDGRGTRWSISAQCGPGETGIGARATGGVSAIRAADRQGAGR